MPELPEVETIRRSLEATVCGRLIREVLVREQRLRHPVDCNALASVVGHRIQCLGRRGKYLLIRLDDGRTVLVHLGMSGRLGLYSPRVPLLAHDHVIFSLEQELQLRYYDPRRFGAIIVLDKGRDGEADMLAALGPEPLSSEFTPSYLMERARGRRVAVKAFLMDSKVVAGVGNIYASEALFVAGIDPRRTAGSLSKEEWRGLHQAVRRVLRDAIRQGGTTLRDGGFRDPAGEAGYFQTKVKVYGRAGMPCGRCGGVVVKTVVGGRSSYYCPCCQR
ncbi:MAG: bifunctional DNA-formamidopyrimidine glycosylase/DNA-(apurinic or apyrimidinic site) lyase [candidate division KSB1 bacterium]|nr:bifunctional DNA-formamidopyrimidine glycosylase/DNA-(apurinic or apyrimidinic site) lyase [candidate division KSB1 bacterium]